ncbi:MAG TPA: hypothetical protein VFH56_13575 [Acidimicrobiales bacterium]|nr:hypothetical protein [Acidimicrobiales bacterium]
MTIAAFAPDEASRAAQQTVRGSRVSPGVVTALDGPRAAGPEAAGVLTLLHTTFADNEGAQRGYKNFAAIKPAFQDRPGFIRWLTFNDGPHGYALGLWRNLDAVSEFVRSAAHRAMVREQQEHPFEYSQFAGVWVAHRVGRRIIYCERCERPNPSPAANCASCGNPLDDSFES